MENRDTQFLEAFKKHVPESAVDYCFQLWKEKPFNFYITRDRSSKLGDFRYRRDRKVQTISINYNLSPYQFLITYIHEVAHYRAFERYGWRIRPHGPEWKLTFRELMLPVLSDKVFPKDVYLVLVRHMKNPKASTGADLLLAKVLKPYDKNFSPDKSLLIDLPLGEIFSLQGRRFRKDQIRRTRVVCEELSTGKKYLISAHAEVRKSD
ncbi:MAG: SprT-like domain-containing protein [Cecembia sp.]